MKIKDTFDGFKQFILRGNVVDLAVGVLVGGAFGALVTSLVKDLFTPLICSNLQAAGFLQPRVHDQWQQVPVWRLHQRDHFIPDHRLHDLLPGSVTDQRADRPHSQSSSSRSDDKKCPFCKSEIMIDATRCAFCTQEVPLTPTGDNAPQPSEK